MDEVIRMRMSSESEAREEIERVQNTLTAAEYDGTEWLTHDGKYLFHTQLANPDSFTLSILVLREDQDKSLKRAKWPKIF